MSDRFDLSDARPTRAPRIQRTRAIVRLISSGDVAIATLHADLLIAGRGR